MKKDQFYRYFTSESVTEGHPDKICDAISDAVLDDVLAHDPDARVACDVAVNTGMVLVMGEITTEHYCDIPKIVREVVKSIGYTDARFGFDYDSCAVLTSIGEQSPDIWAGVSRAEDASADPLDGTGAGDQGMMFGYACRETPELMPLPITLAHALTRALAQKRKSGALPYLRPDGKAQVTVAYEGDTPVFVDTVVVACQHEPTVDTAVLRADIRRMIDEVIPANLRKKDMKTYINPTGSFVTGGPKGDSGLTGRKIICDTYGGYCAHGGGAFSGKDPTKVDRSASYMVRYICKNLVAAGVCDRAELQVSYAIGRAHPVSLALNCFGTEKYPVPALLEAIGKVFDLRPAAIIGTLDLKRPVYAQTAKNGHFGNPAFTWERTDKVNEILAALPARA
ncbi:MAG: methionine adenosyltransferase [Clostridiales bacterium]|jgi:S-adenosylmethionine synthetase|nr:methionine adenosyltransferase [Clostridiales bacterium]